MKEEKHLIGPYLTLLFFVCVILGVGTFLFRQYFENEILIFADYVTAIFTFLIGTCVVLFMRWKGNSD